VFIIMPTNKQLNATPLEGASDLTRGLMSQWGWLHAVRTVLGFLAVIAYLWTIA
jgi:hypothetical protein